MSSNVFAEETVKETFIQTQSDQEHVPALGEAGLKEGGGLVSEVEQDSQWPPPPPRWKAEL